MKNNNYNEQNRDEKPGFRKKVGEVVEKLGDKIEHSVNKDLGDKIERLGEKIQGEPKNRGY